MTASCFIIYKLSNIDKKKKERDNNNGNNRIVLRNFHVYVSNVICCGSTIFLLGSMYIYHYWCTHVHIGTRIHIHNRREECHFSFSLCIPQRSEIAILWRGSDQYDGIFRSIPAFSTSKKKTEKTWEYNQVNDHSTDRCKIRLFVIQLNRNVHDPYEYYNPISFKSFCSSIRSSITWCTKNLQNFICFSI